MVLYWTPTHDCDVFLTGRIAAGTFHVVLLVADHDFLSGQEKACCLYMYPCSWASSFHPFLFFPFFFLFPLFYLSPLPSPSSFPLFVLTSPTAQKAGGTHDDSVCDSCDSDSYRTRESRTFHNGLLGKNKKDLPVVLHRQRASTKRFAKLHLHRTHSKERALRSINTFCTTTCKELISILAWIFRLIE